MGKRAKPEEIIAKLREIEVRLNQGETTGQAVRAIGVTEQTYYRWRKEYGGLQVGQAKRMKDMEAEWPAQSKWSNSIVRPGGLYLAAIMPPSHHKAA